MRKRKLEGHIQRGMDIQVHLINEDKKNVFMSGYCGELIDFNKKEIIIKLNFNAFFPNKEKDPTYDNFVVINRNQIETISYFKELRKEVKENDENSNS